MILADTSVWVDYLRGKSPEMGERLEAGRIAVHPFVVAEIALGSLRDRRRTLGEMEKLDKVKVVRLDELRYMIAAHSLYSRGIGLMDAHLVASCLVTTGTQLWTHDKALKRVAASLGILAQ